MKSKAIILACVLTLLTVGAAHGDPFTFGPPVGNTGDWSNPANWDPPGGPPGSGDEAIIPDGKTCQVTDEQEVEFINVKDGGKLQIFDNGGFLRLGAAAAGALNSTVDGVLQFTTPPNQPPAILRLEQDVIIQGDGAITGDGLIMEDKLTIDGGIRYVKNLEAAGAFNNSATVLATGDRMTFFNDVEGDGVFRTIAVAELRFTFAAQMLMSADFDLDGERLRIVGQDGTVATSGSLVWTDGDIWINWRGTYFKVGIVD